MTDKLTPQERVMLGVALDNELERLAEQGSVTNGEWRTNVRRAQNICRKVGAPPPEWDFEDYDEEFGR